MCSQVHAAWLISTIHTHHFTPSQSLNALYLWLHILSLTHMHYISTFGYLYAQWRL
jgi:hypothetical protein